jgi:hypothetical protein
MNQEHANAYWGIYQHNIELSNCHHHKATHSHRLKFPSLEESGQESAPAELKDNSRISAHSAFRRGCSALQGMGRMLHWT